MGKSSPSAPAQPDPVKTANAQTASNKETAYWNAVLNNVNQVTPYGNLTYEQSGGGKTYNQAGYDKALAAWNSALANGASAAPKTRQELQAMPVSEQRKYTNTPQGYVLQGSANGGANAGVMPQLKDFQTGDAPPSFTSTINLSPEQKAIYDTQTKNQKSLLDMGTGQLDRINQSVSTPYGYGGIGNEVNQQDLATQTKGFEDALYSRIDPQFARDEEALRTRLINQGIGQGSQAYNTEMERFNQAKTDARMQAVLQGAQYGGTLQNQAMQRRNQSIQEYDAQRNAPLNEYIGLTSGVQVQNPQFSSQSYAGAQSGDIQGATQNAYNNAMQQYNSKVASNNSTQSSLFGLGGSLLGAAGGAGGFAPLFAGMFSDKRLKENIKPVGEENGHKIYEFNYKKRPDQTYIGVMAQDVEKTHPKAVHEINGFKYVDYKMIGVKMREVKNG